MKRCIAGTAVAVLLLSSGCAWFQTSETPVPLPVCDATAFAQAAVLPLPPAAATRPRPRKGVPLKVASSFPVGGGVNDIGTWTTTDDGVSAWRLRLVSTNAKSMALHLKPFQLADGAQLWLCTPGGEKQGPFTGKGPSTIAELWSPALTGSELWLELSAPDAQRKETQLGLKEVFAAFR